MKKLVALILMVGLLMPSQYIAADELMDLTYKAGYKDAKMINRPKSSIVIDGKTGDILWQDNVDEIRDPASMSKVLALYLVFEAMAEGKFSPDTIVTATPEDQAIAKIHRISNNNIVAGVNYTVSELITATVVPSSNAATLMLARLVEEDPDLFLDKMNAKAKELGMTNSHFYNASGAMAWAFDGYYKPKRYDNYRNNETTARDYAILTYHFLKDYPDILKYSGESTVKIKEGTPYEESFESYNYSLPNGEYGIKGVTGLKTGSSPTAAFNLTATAKRGEQEIIAVIMGVGDWSDQGGEYYRHPFANALMEKAFADYDYKKVIEKGVQRIGDKKVNVQKDVYATVSVDKAPQMLVKEEQLVIDNGLKNVSPMIEKEQQAILDHDVSVSDESATSAKKSGASDQGEHVKNILITGGLIVLVFAGLVIMNKLRHLFKK